MKITAHTATVALFGWPAKHSLSPLMHNAAFDHLGLDYRYMVYHVSPEDLEAAIAAARVLNFTGLNVTIPHKENVMGFLDEIEPEASFIGAVNTIVRDGSRLKGYNTDGRGFMMSLEHEKIDVKDKRVFVLGAGGAAKAVCYHLCESAGELLIFNRTPERAEVLAEGVGGRCAKVKAVKSFKKLAVADVVINATSLGLNDNDSLPCEPSHLHKGQTVYDLVYKNTPLLIQAKKLGAKTVNGAGMLIYQGILSIELWTGKTPSYDVMRKALP